MKSIKPRVKYQGISLSVPFIAEIKKHVMYNPKYNSIADFAREALREKLQRGQSEIIGFFFNIFVKKSDEELVREMIRQRHKDFSDLSFEEMKEEFQKVVASVKNLKQKEKKELLQKKVELLQKKELLQGMKEPVIQLSKSKPTDMTRSELTDMIQSIVTETLDKKEKKE